MSLIFLHYPKCSTSNKAKKWLDSQNVDYFERHMIAQNPSAEELEFWWKQSRLPLKKFFNTSGVLYKQMNLKDKLPQMSEQEQLQLLSTNGMLVKRPLLIGEDFVLVGFHEDEWQKVK